ncbi:MAG TPA: hypothetical protein VHP32_01845 [Ignavibacteria bacterium]|nr:hypothetical protein [Ignavibacteria bacterium]
MEKEDYKKSLNLKTLNDLRKYVLNNWLKIAESDKIEHKIIALKELGKYSFTPSNSFSAGYERIFNNEN